MANEQGRSPYQRKGKTPYKYAYPQCNHRTAVEEVYRIELQDGTSQKYRVLCCTVCHTVVSAPEKIV